MEENKKELESVLETEENKDEELEENKEEVIEESSVEEVEVPLEKEAILIKNATAFDYRTMKYLNVYILKYKKKSFLVYLIFSLVTLGVAVYSFVNSLLNDEKVEFVFPILFVLFAAYMLYQGLSIEKSLDKQLVNFFRGKEITIQEIEIGEENLYVARGTKYEMGEAVKIDWVNINEIHELPGYYYLFMGNNPIVIDKNPDTYLVGTAEEMDSLIQEKAQSRKYVKIDKEIIKGEITYVHEEVSVVSHEEAKDAEFVESVVEESVDEKEE